MGNPETINIIDRYTREVITVPVLYTIEELESYSGNGIRDICRLARNMHIGGTKYELEDISPAKELDGSCLLEIPCTNAHGKPDSFNPGSYAYERMDAILVCAAVSCAYFVWAYRLNAEDDTDAYTLLDYLFDLPTQADLRLLASEHAGYKNLISGVGKTATIEIPAPFSIRVTKLDIHEHKTILVYEYYPEQLHMYNGEEIANLLSVHEPLCSITA